MLKKTLIFITGAALGSLVTWKLIEKKYKDLANEEIESVKEIFKNKKPEVKLETTLDNIKNNDNIPTSQHVKLLPLSNNMDSVDYSKIIEMEKYKCGPMSNNKNLKIGNMTISNHDNYTHITPNDELLNEENYTVNTEEDLEDERTIPYVIEPEEFGEIPHYGTKTLTYYNDDILTDEIDQIIENRDDIIGPDALTHIGEFEMDAVHIRDIDNEMDYEILKSDLLFKNISDQNGD